MERRESVTTTESRGKSESRRRPNERLVWREGLPKYWPVVNSGKERRQ